MNITIHDLPGTERLDYRKIKDLQGSLKDLKRDNYDKLVKSLQTHGFTFPGFVWRDGEDYYAIDLHQRLRVMNNEDMNDNGSYDIPVVFIPAIDRVEAKTKLLLATSQYGSMSQEGFDEFIADLPEVEIIEAVHFDALPYLGKEDEPEVEEDTPPELSEEPPVSKLGEVYQLGKHRVMCGDATSKEDLDRLMAGAKANLIFTDPPYGVGFERGKFVGRNKQADGGQHFEPIKGDDLRGDALRELVATALSNARDHATEASLYCWSPPLQEGFEIYRGIQDAGFKIQSQIIWNKTPFVIGRADYHWKHEVCWYGFQEHHQWYGGRDKATVWDVPKVQVMDSHPTMKPIELCAKALKNSTQANGVVLDVFGGSGSTLIAAEQLDRVCYMVELDPRYVDVIRRRYATFVGKEENWVEATPSINIEAISL